MIHKIRQRAGDTAGRERAAHVVRAASGSRAVSQPHDFLEIGNFAPFSKFLHFKGRHFPDLFPFKSTYNPYEKFHGNRSSRYSEMRNTGTQIDRQTRQLYIDRLEDRLPLASTWMLSPRRRPAVTLTFDLYLQNVIRLSVRVIEYSL